ncbi:MAG: GFA family protein [Rhodanobacter sp.]|jgi:hypothetical protein|nr:GFA family protein [Rhodanobacter sp.]
MTTYTGGCHCGRVAFDIETEGPITKAMECNCSICSKRGYLLAFFPAARVHMHTPDSHLSTYTFNKQVIQHRFCPVCGVASFIQGKGHQGSGMYAINVRCLDGVDLHALKIEPFDGRSR